MAASRSLGSRTARRPHLIASGKGGLAGEIGKLRTDVDDALLSLESASPIAALAGYIIPIQAVDADGIMTAQASAAAPQTFTGAQFDGILAPGSGDAEIHCPKRMTIVIAGGTPAHWLGGTVVITGTDVNGIAQVENLTVAAGAGTTTSTNRFATISSVACPASGGVDATIGLGVAAETGCIASGGSTTGVQTLDVDAEFNRTMIGNREMGIARALALVLNNHADWDATNMVVSGFDINGDAISETIAIPNGGNTTVNGTKFFAQVTSISIPAQSGTNGTWALGIRDTILGLPVLKADGVIAAVGIKELTRADDATAWSAAAAGTVTDAASALPNGSYTPNTGPDGASGRRLLYITG